MLGLGNNEETHKKLYFKATREDLDKFIKMDRKLFIEDFKVSNENIVESDEDVYSLLLSAAIALSYITKKTPKTNNKYIEIIKSILIINLLINITCFLNYTKFYIKYKIFYLIVPNKIGTHNLYVTNTTY